MRAVELSVEFKSDGNSGEDMVSKPKDEMEEAESGDGRELADDSAPAEWALGPLRGPIRTPPLAHSGHALRGRLPPRSLPLPRSGFRRESLFPSLQPLPWELMRQKLTGRRPPRSRVKCFFFLTVINPWTINSMYYIIHIYLTN